MGGRAAFFTGGFGGNQGSLITQAAVDQASSVLSAAQVAALRQVQEEQQARIKAAELIRAADRGGNAAPQPKTSIKPGGG